MVTRGPRVVRCNSFSMHFKFTCVSQFLKTVEQINHGGTSGTVNADASPTAPAPLIGSLSAPFDAAFARDRRHRAAAAHPIAAAAAVASSAWQEWRSEMHRSIKIAGSAPAVVTDKQRDTETTTASQTDTVLLTRRTPIPPVLCGPKPGDGAGAAHDLFRTKTFQICIRK